MEIHKEASLCAIEDDEEVKLIEIGLKNKQEKTMSNCIAKSCECRPKCYVFKHGRLVGIDESQNRVSAEQEEELERRIDSFCNQANRLQCNNIQK